MVKYYTATEYSNGRHAKREDTRAEDFMFKCLLRNHSRFTQRPRHRFELATSRAQTTLRSTIREGRSQGGFSTLRSLALLLAPSPSMLIRLSSACRHKVTTVAGRHAVPVDGEAAPPDRNVKPGIGSDPDADDLIDMRKEFGKTRNVDRESRIGMLWKFGRKLGLDMRAQGWVRKGYTDFCFQ